jgi:hypothetical protein
VARRACFGGAGTRTLPRGRASNAAASSTFRRRAIGGLGRPRRRACRWLCDCGVCRGGLGPGRAAPRCGGRDPRARRRARGDGPSPDADAPSRASPCVGHGLRHERVGFRRGVRGLIDEVRLRCSPALGVVLARRRLRLADPPVSRGADGAHGARPARIPPHDGRRAQRAIRPNHSPLQPLRSPAAKTGRRAQPTTTTTITETTIAGVALACAASGSSRSP